MAQNVKRVVIDLVLVSLIIPVVFFFFTFLFKFSMSSAYLLSRDHPSLYFPTAYLSIMFWIWITFVVIRQAQARISFSTLRFKRAPSGADGLLRGLLPIPPEFPQNLPALANAFISAPLYFFLMGGPFAESLIGRPSSTAGIGYALILVLVTFIAIMVTLAARALRHEMLRKPDMRLRLPVLAQSFIYTLIVLLTLCPFYYKWSQVEASEDRHKPHVIYSNGRIARTEAPVGLNVQDSTAIACGGPLAGPSGPAGTIDSTRNRVSFSTRGNLLIVNSSNASGTLSTDVNLRGNSYISAACAMPVDTGDEMLIALMVAFRPTSKRSMMLVYDQQLNLIYKELLRRYRMENSMSTAIDGSDNLYLVHSVEGTPAYYLISEAVTEPAAARPTSEAP